MATVTGQLPEFAPAARARQLPLVGISWFAALLIIAYFPTLKLLVQQWSTDEDVGHGFFVPLVAGFIAWQRRDQLMSIRWNPSPGERLLGALVMLWGILQSYIGTLGAELFLQRTALLVTLVGLLILLGGLNLVKALAFPLLLLPFMIPFPAVVYNQITFPLQLFASSTAETALGMLGIPVLRDGNVLELASQKLNVAEACSGIRSLLSLSFLSLVYAYFFDKKVWMRWALLIGTVPIAILANAGRVTITGILSERDPELAHGFFHSLEGWIIFFVAFVMLLALHGAMNSVYRWKFAKEPPPA
jgi:exosortase